MRCQMISGVFVQKTQSNFGGPRAGSFWQALFRSCTNFLLFCRDLSNYNKFAAFVQKRLDTRPRCGYTGAGTTFGFAHRFRTGAPAPKIPKSQALLSQKEIEGSRPDGNVSGYRVDEIDHSGPFCKFHNAYPISSGFSSGSGQP